MNATDKIMVWAGTPEHLFDLVDAIAEVTDQSVTASQRSGKFFVRGVQALTQDKIAKLLAQVTELEPTLTYEGIVED